MGGIEVVSSVQVYDGPDISKAVSSKSQRSSSGKSVTRKFSMKRNLKLSKLKKNKKNDPQEITSKIIKNTKKIKNTKEESSKHKKTENAARRLASKVLPAAPSSIKSMKKKDNKRGAPTSKRKFIPKMISKVLPKKSTSSRSCDESLISDGSMTAAASNCSSCHELSIAKTSSFDSMNGNQSDFEAQEALKESSYLPKAHTMRHSTSYGNLSAISEQETLTELWGCEDSISSLPTVVSFQSSDSMIAQQQPARLIISATPDDMSCSVSSAGTTGSHFTDGSSVSMLSNATEDDDFSMASSVDTNNLVQKIEDLATRANHSEYRLPQQLHRNNSNEILVENRDPPKAPTKQPTITPVSTPQDDKQQSQQKTRTPFSITATYLLFLGMSLLSKTTVKTLKLILDLIVTITSQETNSARRRRRRKWKQYQDKHDILFNVAPFFIALNVLTTLASQSSFFTLPQNHVVQLFTHNPDSSHVALGIAGFTKALVWFWIMIQGQKHWIDNVHNDQSAQIQQQKQHHVLRRVSFAPSTTTTTA